MATGWTNIPGLHGKQNQSLSKSQKKNEKKKRRREKDHAGSVLTADTQVVISKDGKAVTSISGKETGENAGANSSSVNRPGDDHQNVFSSSASGSENEKFEQRLSNEKYFMWLKSLHALMQVKIGIKEFITKTAKEQHRSIRKEVLQTCSNGPQGCKMKKDDRDIVCEAHKKWMDHIEKAARKEVKDESSGNYKKMLNWKNCRTEALMGDFWQMAKVYMGPYQSASTNADDCDPSGLLQLMVNNTNYLQAQKDRVAIESVEKVIKMRHELMHTASQQVELVDFEQYIASCLEVARLQKLRENNDSIDAVIAELERIRHVTLNSVVQNQFACREWKEIERKRIEEDLKQRIDFLEAGLTSIIESTLALTKFVQSELDIQHYLRDVPQLIKKFEDTDQQRKKADKKVQESLIDVASQQKKILDKIDDFLPDNIEQQSFREVKNAFQCCGKAFKLLLINKPDIQKSQIIKLATILGSCPWDFIIDLDHDSRVNGIFDPMSKILRQNKHFRCIMYNETQSLSDAERKSIAESEQGIWLLANGCPQSKLSKSEESFVQVLDPLDHLLEGILKEMPYRKVVLTTVCILSRACQSPLKRLATRLEDVFEKSMDYVKRDESYFVTLSLYSDISIASSDTVMQPKYLSAPLDQILSVFNPLHVQMVPEDIFKYPGKNDWCTLTTYEYNTLKTLFTLYHENIGKVNFTTDDIVGEVDKVKVSYLKGDKVSPELFYLHENYPPCYALRSEMETALEMIEEELKAKELASENQFDRAVFTIQHDHSGGGSTVLGYVLYSLRKRYPCIQLDHIESAQIDRLKHIHKNSQKPLLIGIDSPNISYEEASSFCHRLCNDFIVCLLVFTRVNLKPESVPSHDKKHSMLQQPEVRRRLGEELKHHIYVSATLKSKEDKTKFQRIYDVIASKVYLFGLNAFLGEYKRLHEIVTRCSDEATLEQLRVLRLVCCLDKYSGHKIKARLLASLLSLDTEKFGEDGSVLLEAFGSVGDLLIYDTKRYWIRVVNACVIKPFYDELEKKQAKTQILETSVQDLVQLISRDLKDKKMSASVCSKLLINREDLTKEHYSPFMADMIKTFTHNLQFVSEQLQKIIHLFAGSDVANHLRVLYARFLLYEMKNLPETETQIKLALNIPDKSIRMSEPLKIHELLHAYGSLYRTIAYTKFDQSIKDSSSQDDEKALDNLLEDIKESVRAFELAQSFKKSPLAYIGEAKARCNLLHRIFMHECNKDHSKFRDYIDKTSNEFIQRCEAKAFIALDKIKRHQEINATFDTNADETFKQIVDTTLRLLRLRCDRDISVPKMLQLVKFNTLCDVGLLVRARNMRLYEEGRKELRDFKDLENHELEQIVTLLESHISSNSLLYANYENIIEAMILLRQNKQSTYRKYNIDYAIYCAELWKMKYQDSFSAHFMHAVLCLVSASEPMVKKKNKLIKAALTSLANSRTILQENPAARDRRRFKYMIGRGSGLERVLPYSKDTGCGKLHLFTGRLITRQEVSISEYGDGFFAVVTKREYENILTAEQTPSVFFNLIVANDALIAYNVKVQE